LTSKSFIAVPRWIYGLDLSHREFIVYVGLIHEADFHRDRREWSISKPGLKRIKELTRMGHALVGEALERLEARDLIRTTKPGRGRAVTEYLVRTYHADPPCVLPCKHAKDSWADDVACSHGSTPLDPRKEKNKSGSLQRVDPMLDSISKELGLNR
jgi:hypothetical protein